jgi:hypothetical protein
MVFRKDVAGRGVTYYNIGGKKLINVFCGERPDVMCCASADDEARKTSLYLDHTSFLNQADELETQIVGERSRR